MPQNPTSQWDVRRFHPHRAALLQVAAGVILGVVFYLPLYIATPVSFAVGSVAYDPSRKGVVLAAVSAVAVGAFEFWRRAG